MSHLFISYAHEDYHTFVHRFREDLFARDQNVWLDRANVRPGTADWENAIREAIEEAYVVVLVASPASRKSQFVRDELAIARVFGRKIVPVWARGDVWIDCIPMGSGYIQYIDMRAAKYDPGLDALVEELAELQTAEAVPAAPTSPPSKAPPTEIRNPYKGLNPFYAEDREDFFGRDNLARQVIDLATEIAENAPRFLAIVGASGSGKSSLAMAGILPRLIGDHGWTVLKRLTPGAQPVDALRRILVPSLPHRTSAQIRDELEDGRAEGLRYLAEEVDAAQVVLFVDQFEELFTLTQAEHDRRQFIDLLHNAVTDPSGNLLALVTLRADFYQPPLNYASLAELLDGQRTKNVPAMTISDLVDAIMKPAELVGLQFESGLVAEIVYALREDQRALAGALPLLQFALERLYTERDDHTLTLGAYNAMGGVQGAIGSHAEAVFCELDDDAQNALGNVFLALVNVDERGTPTRKRAMLEAVRATEPAQRLVDALVANRLLVAGGEVDTEPYVELAHEALLKSWERLVAWIGTIANDLKLRNQVERAAQDWWDTTERPDYLLWPHERLAPVYAMQERLQTNFDRIVNAFIEPEAERLLTEFKRGRMPEHRLLTIIDRWAEIGEMAVNAMCQAWPLMTGNRQSGRDRLIRAMYPYRETVLEILHTCALSENEALVENTVEAYRDHWNQQALPYLLPILQSPTAAGRRAAAEALGELGNQTAVEDLITALEDPDASVRCAVIDALSKIGDPVAEKPIISVLRDPDPDVRNAARIAVSKLADPEDLARIFADQGEADTENSNTDSEIPDQLRGPGTGTSPIREHYAPDPDIWFVEVAKALGHDGSAAVTSLISALNDADLHVRRAAAFALGQIGDRSAVDPLISALDDADLYVRSDAANALGQIGDRSAVDPLISALNDPAAFVRQTAANALGQLGNRATINSPLTTALDDTRSFVSRAAAYVLRQASNRSAVGPLLTTALGDNDVFVRRDATYALGQLGDRSAVDPLIHTLVDTDANVRSSAAYALGQLEDTGAVKPLITGLADTSPKVRSSAAYALGQLGDTRAVDPLIITALADTDSNVRSSAACALGHLGDTGAVETLIVTLADTDSDVRRNAACALGHLGDTGAVETLITVLGDNDEGVRGAAARALGQIGDPTAVPSLGNLLVDIQRTSVIDDGKNRVCGYAASALEQIDTNEALAALEQWQQDDPDSYAKWIKWKEGQTAAETDD